MPRCHQGQTAIVGPRPRLPRHDRPAPPVPLPSPPRAARAAPAGAPTLLHRRPERGPLDTAKDGERISVCPPPAADHRRRTRDSGLGSAPPPPPPRSPMAVPGCRPNGRQS